VPEGGYGPTYEVLAELVGELSPAEQRSVLGDTARRVYRLT
jgi:L-fuconolactonase